ncbi:uncharacterized protein LOC143577386 [Bidens hawaiensis]|uniref:uncharacterized protein LOC143577386 n=1 Tax=Bidens hawaiensis TaxID=980011 RepID=UPI004048EE47
MAERDQDKTTFRTDKGTFCYKMMPFVLKNAGATYQPLMDKQSGEQIGNNLEVYMDDLVIKSLEEDQMLWDIKDTYQRLRSMKLNPSKCSFRMEEGKFLGVIVTKNGFKANPEKVQAISCMSSPKSLKEHCGNTKSDFCISASSKAVGAVLLVDHKKIQTPIYYVSKTRYSIMENMVLALTPKLSGRLEKWAIELGEHTIQYSPMPVVKGQVMADFIVEVPYEKEHECRAEEKSTVIIEENEAWSLFTDGASNDEGPGTRLNLISPRKQEFTYAIRLDFNSTNNEAEYEAFLAGLRIADKFEAQHVEAHVDSLLMASQVNGSYEDKDEVLASYLEQDK